MNVNTLGRISSMSQKDYGERRRKKFSMECSQRTVRQRKISEPSKQRFYFPAAAAAQRTLCSSKSVCSPVANGPSIRLRTDAALLTAQLAQQPRLGELPIALYRFR